MTEVEFLHFHLFCGLGGGAKGFNSDTAKAKVGNLSARFRCIGGVDVMPAAIEDFNRLTDCQGTVLDLFSREQYIAFHGKEPPADWREVTPADLHLAAGNERPNVIFSSPPCKGLSGLLSEKQAQTHRYQALNALTLRGIWLALEAWGDDPPEFFLLENVPRIQTRGDDLLTQIEQLLQRYGYATARSTHDCGELGGLAQSRRRFLLVARHRAKVPPFLYEPCKKSLRPVGDILGALPLPGHPSAGPMHDLPKLQWRTWLRLAFVEAGGDWRSLERLQVENGFLKDYGIVPEGAGWYRDILGVLPWLSHGVTVTGNAKASSGRFSVADPRFFGRGEYGQYGVKAWSDIASTVTSQSAPGGGRYAVADPRLQGKRFNNIYRVISWHEVSPAVTAGGGPTSGGLGISDPRAGWGGDHLQQACCNYGVQPYPAPVNANQVPDESFLPGSEMDSLPSPSQQLIAVIRALDGTWHRPFSTLELAALQGLVEPDEFLLLHGASHSGWRERIGNAVPPPAAAAVGHVIARTLLLAMTGETFILDAMPVWVKPVAIAAAVETPAPL